MTNKNFINIYNNLIKFSRNKSIFTSFTDKDTFSDRLLIFLFHFGFFLRNIKKPKKGNYYKMFSIIFLESLKLVLERLVMVMHQ